MATITELVTQTKIVIEDSAGVLSDDDRIAHIRQAYRVYSRDKPRYVDDAITGDASGSQIFSVPSDWEQGFSVLFEAEYPVDDTPRQLIDIEDNIEVIQVSNVEKIQTETFTITSGADMRVFFSAPHTSGSSIPDNDFYAVANLAGAFCAQQLANFYSENMDTTLSADNVDHRSQAQAFSTRMKELLNLYADHIEAGGATTAVLDLQDSDISFTWGGDLLMHPKRYR